MVVALDSASNREVLRGVANNVLLAYWDADLRCRFANQTYERWFGVSPERLIGSHVTDHLRSTYERNRHRIEAALRGEAQRFECDIPGRDGVPLRHCLANYIPDVVDGKVRGFYVMTSDITELKQSQYALVESQARFAKIVALAGDAIISIDAHRKVGVFNASAEEIYGYTAPEVLGRDVVMFGPERFHAEYADAIDQFTRNADAVSVVRATRGVGRRKNGEEFPVEVTLSKFQLGGATQVTLLVRDITQRVRADLEQRVLAETGAMLSASLDYKETLQAIVDLIVKHLADSCAIDVLSREGTFERVAFGHVDPAKAGLVEEIATLRSAARNTISHQVVESRAPVIYQDVDTEVLRGYAKDETHLNALIKLDLRSTMVMPLMLQGEVFGALILGSEQPHRYTDADIPLATELARRAALAIHNARLYAAERRATHGRDEILEIVAHDLRAPLNSILLGAQILQYSHIEDPEARKEIESIVRSTQWANRLIEDLLDVRRIEEGILSITPARVSPREVVIAALPMHSLVATAAGIAIRQDIATDVREVWADRDRLLQVLENLVGNAVKFTSPGGRISIAAVNEPGFVRFSVRDTGTGIPEANLERVFDRFWQANRTERRGAGLGLPICKGIVEKHGGKIWGESSIGHGTTFHFTLPVAS